MENNDSININSSSNSNRRDNFLKFMLILSALSAFIGFIGNALMGLLCTGALGLEPAIVREQMIQSFTLFGLENNEELGNNVDLLISNAPILSITGVLVSVLSMYGVIKMWKMQRSGFHFYTAARVLEQGIPLGIASARFFSPLSLAWSVLFIVIYHRRIKQG